MEEEDYDALLKNPDQADQDMRMVLKDISSIKSQLEVKNTEQGTDNVNLLESIQRQVRELKEARPTATETENEENQQPITWSEVVSKNVRKEVSKAVEKKMETGKREKNVILYRIKEKEDKEEAKAHDQEMINKLLTVCKVDTENVVEFKRLGAKPDDANKDRPILVIFKELENKITLFKNVSNLADAEKEVKAISVNHDMSKDERKDLKKKVDEAKGKEKDDPDHRYRVRGPPGNWRIVRMPLAGHSD